MLKFLGLITHLAVFTASILFIAPKITFYGILSKVAENNLLHLLHTTLCINILLLLSFHAAEKILGPLNSSETQSYNEKIYTMFGDLVMIISFFPYDLEMVNLLYFSILYFFRSFSWMFSIKSLRISSKQMIIAGLIVAGITSFLSYFFYKMFKASVIIFSINILFSLEYALVSLSLFKSVFIMMLNGENTFLSFVINIVYLSIKSIAYFFFIMNVAMKYKFPFSTARSLISTLFKLKKKISLLKSYIQLDKDIRAVKEVSIDGTCAICTDDLKRGKMLKCKHAFHAECLKMWCERETSCPICRAELVFNREETFETEDEIITAVPIN